MSNDKKKSISKKKLKKKTKSTRVNTSSAIWDCEKLNLKQKDLEKKIKDKTMKKNSSQHVLTWLNSKW
jgi:hypothetical protein